MDGIIVDVVLVGALVALVVMIVQVWRGFNELDATYDRTAKKWNEVAEIYKSIGSGGSGGTHKA